MLTPVEQWLCAHIRYNNSADTFTNFIDKYNIGLNTPIEFDSERSFTPALIAAQWNAHNVIPVLAARGVNLSERIEIKPGLWWTPALLAAQWNADKVITALAERGVNLSERIEYLTGVWRTPALMAAELNADKVIPVLAARDVNLSERIEIKPDLWLTPALIAAKSNAVNVITALAGCGVVLSERIEVKPGLWWTPALMAAKSNAVNVITALAKCFVDLSERIQLKPEVWRTPALMAAECNSGKVIAELARLQMSLSASTELSPGLWRTPAQMAARCNSCKVIEALAKCGVNLRIPFQTEPGIGEWWTPSHLAVQNNANEAVKALVLAGVPINARQYNQRPGDPIYPPAPPYYFFQGDQESPFTLKTYEQRGNILRLMLGQRNNNDFPPREGGREYQVLYRDISEFQQRLLAATVTVRQLQASGDKVIPFEIIQVIVSFSALSGLTLPHELDARMLRQLFDELCRKVLEDRSEKIIEILASYAIERQTWLLSANKAVSLLDPQQRKTTLTAWKTYFRTERSQREAPREGKLEDMDSNARRKYAYRAVLLGPQLGPNATPHKTPFTRLSSDDQKRLYPKQAVVVVNDVPLEEIAMSVVRTCIRECLTEQNRQYLACRIDIQNRLIQDRAQMLVALWHEVKGRREDTAFHSVCEAAMSALKKCEFSLEAVRKILLPNRTRSCGRFSSRPDKKHHA